MLFRGCKAISAQMSLFEGHLVGGPVHSHSLPAGSHAEGGGFGVVAAGEAPVLSIRVSAAADGTVRAPSGVLHVHQQQISVFAYSCTEHRPQRQRDLFVSQ